MNNLVAIETIFVNILFWGVLAACIFFWAEIIGKLAWARLAGAVGMGLGLLGSIGAMVMRYYYAGYPPLSNLFESLLGMIFALLAIYLVIEWRMKPKFFGAAAAPLAFLLIGFASVLPARLKDAHPLMPALQSYWLKIHVSLMLISYAAFFLAFGAAVVYLILHRRGNRDDQGGGGTLALEGGSTFGQTRTQSTTLAFFDEITYRLILLGFPLLALGIITGGIWANAAWGTYWSWDPKETWSLITWLVYAGYLHARLTRDWRDQRAAIFAIVGFVSVLVTYLGVNYLAQGLHTYGSLL
jgi:cytochrome c-type biogenesis protein CcsB